MSGCVVERGAYNQGSITDTIYSTVRRVDWSTRHEGSGEGGGARTAAKGQLGKMTARADHWGARRGSKGGEGVGSEGAKITGAVRCSAPGAEQRRKRRGL